MASMVTVSPVGSPVAAVGAAGRPGQLQGEPIVVGGWLTIGRCHWSGSICRSNGWDQSFSSALMAMASWWPMRRMLRTGTMVSVVTVVLLRVRAGPAGRRLLVHDHPQYPRQSPGVQAGQEPGDGPARFSEINRCGIPASLVHGDFHPGNVRGTPGSTRRHSQAGRARRSARLCCGHAGFAALVADPAAGYRRPVGRVRARLDRDRGAR